MTVLSEIEVSGSIRPLHFLWLHPSDDPEVLEPLFKSYMESDLVNVRDIVMGYHSLLIHELMRATSPYKSLKEYPFPYMGKKNIILFRIMFGDISFVKERIIFLAGDQEKADEYEKLIFEILGYHHFIRIWLWFLQDVNSELMLNGLYQYDEVFEWCLTTMTPAKASELLDDISHPEEVLEYQKALFCIHYFNTEKENDTCRTQFVHKIRKILDEREFVPEFKQMWKDIKAGKIEVQDPWAR